MLEVEKYKLSTYRAVETLRETKDSLVEIVESTFDGERYIRKTYHSDKRTVYNSIKNIENANIPKVHDYTLYRLIRGKLNHMANIAVER